ncbi:hypothetical protein J7643_06980 [bacterium]|nr:hypothetical protein [bacterium]
MTKHPLFQNVLRSLVVGLCLATLAGCAAEDDDLPLAGKIPTSSGDGGSGTDLNASVTGEKEPTPSPSLALTVSPQGEVVTTPKWIELYPEPVDRERGLGNPSQAKLHAELQFPDGGKGPIRWSVPAGSGLSMASDGTLSVPSSVQPGIYYVKAQALDVESLFAYVQVKVSPLSELEVLIR